MATRAERNEVLEQYSDTDWEELTQRIGGVALEKPQDRRIKLLLDAADAADRAGYGDEYDRALRLPTNTDQQRELQRKALATSESSTRASWVSAHAAWVSVGISLVALIVSIIALVVAAVK